MRTSIFTPASLVFLLVTTSRAAAAERQHCAKFAMGSGLAGIFHEGESDVYSSTGGPNIQLEGGYAYCGFGAVQFGGAVHYWHGFGVEDNGSYDFLSFDAVLGVHGSVGSVDVGLRAGPGLLLFFKPTTTVDGFPDRPDTFVLFTPFIGPEVAWWVSPDIGIMLTGDFRFSPVPDAELQGAVSLGGEVAAVVRF